MTPNLDFEGLVNLRDVGGASGVRSIRPSVLFRSETPQLMTDADVQRARTQLGITRVVDLRGPRGNGSGPLAAGGRGVVLDFFEIASLVQAESDESPDGFLPAQLDRAAGVAGRFFEELVANPGATLVHCHTGKDRTGFVVAMTLAAAGASDEEIIADYERSAPVFATMMTNLAAVGRAVPESAPEFARDAPSAKGIRALMHRLRAEWASPEDYLVAGGVDRALVRAVRRRLAAGC
ncbi:MAG: tyrosine-protein phosphatase [Actinomycetota bacterium]|nr:tyrosine-protein phosphatase [Actinomycetota bacterium]